MLAKVEYMNPGGSVKDRIALRMIEAAEESGELKPGGTIVEPTSGNTGVGLAIVAQRSGYKCVFVCPDKVSQDKQRRAAGVRRRGRGLPDRGRSRTTRTPTTRSSDRLVREIDGAWKPNQYANPRDRASHYETTGPEIWADTDGRVTHFVAGVGTGGTISGTGRYLKEVSERRRVAGRRRRPRGLGLLRRHRPPLPRRGRRRGLLADRRTTRRSSTRSSRCQRRRLVRDDPPAGPRGGPARRRLLRHGGRGGAAGGRSDLPADAVVVVLLPDAGRGYMSKIFNDDWMSSYGFLHANGETTVGDVLDSKAGGLPALVHTHPSETIRDADRASCASTASRRCRSSRPSRR